MVFGIVQQHHGWIECSSTVRQGTRFDIYLPRSTQATDIRSAPTNGQALTGSETILLVDDNPMIRDVGRTILEMFGYRILCAEDGQEALAIYRQKAEDIHLVILDLTMPHLSGRDTLRELRRLNPDVWVLFASGYSSERVTETEQDRVLGFIPKPYAAHDLASAVRSALDKIQQIS
jgi:CheY-like chemotaxis protein